VLSRLALSVLRAFGVVGGPAVGVLGGGALHLLHEDAVDCVAV
jgi:hypothetical protein